MEDLQMVLAKLHDFQQRNAGFSEFEKILTIGSGREEEGCLQKKISGLDAEIECKMKVHKKANTDNKQLLKDLQAEAELRKAKKEAKEKLVSTMEEELAHLDMEKASVTEEPKSEQTTRRLEEEEAFSVKQLGLEINKVKGGWLQFVFTQIDTQRPQSKFLFSLKLDDNRKYIVSDCQPEISDMDNLVEKLNSSNSLSTFVHSVRKRFADLVHT